MIDLAIVLTGYWLSHAAGSEWQHGSTEDWEGHASPIIRVEVVDAENAAPLPVRARVTASDGSQPDGSGRGVYRDGRFYAEATFEVEVPPGTTSIRLVSGPT